jgi:glycine/D-amino acid oxidase-like deaminating enzyme
MRTIIVGGGIAGVALSKFLAKRGVSVILLEKSAQLCSGATWHAAGTKTPQVKQTHR